jgi:arylsulfatase A-like enzyme
LHNRLWIRFLENHHEEKPFFMTISHIEPHHQNDRHCYEGPIGSKIRFKDYELPGDLKALKGDADKEYPDYLGCCRSLDDNLGRLIDKLKEKNLYDNTIIVFASDHGSHFRTRNNDAHLNGYDDYKRTCHSGCLHVPLIISGPGFRGGKRIKELVSTASLPKTFLAMAGINVGNKMIGEDLSQLLDKVPEERDNEIFAQISESRVGRCIRTKNYLYSVYAPNKMADYMRKVIFMKRNFCMI